MGVSLEKAHKKYQRERLINDTLRKAETEIINVVSSNCLAACCLVLHDKFGFGKKRLTEYMAWVYDCFDSISRDYVSFDDLKECIYDEMGIDFDEVEKERLLLMIKRKRGEF